MDLLFFGKLFVVGIECDQVRKVRDERLQLHFSSLAGYLGRSTALQPRLQKRLKATIVVVHGFMNTSESTLPLARHLYDAGYRVCNFEYASELGTIAQHTNSLLEYVEYVRRTEISCFSS